MPPTASDSWPSGSPWPQVARALYFFPPLYVGSGVDDEDEEGAWIFMCHASHDLRRDVSPLILSGACFTGNRQDAPPNRLAPPAPNQPVQYVTVHGLTVQLGQTVRTTDPCMRQTVTSLASCGSMASFFDTPDTPVKGPTKGAGQRGRPPWLEVGGGGRGKRNETTLEIDRRSHGKANRSAKEHWPLEPSNPASSHAYGVGSPRPLRLCTTCGLYPTLPDRGFLWHLFLTLFFSLIPTRFFPHTNPTSILAPARTQPAPSPPFVLRATPLYPFSLRTGVSETQRSPERRREQAGFPPSSPGPLLLKARWSA